MQTKIRTENVINLGFHIGDIACTLLSVLPFHNRTIADRKYYEHHHHHFEIHVVRQGECSFLCNNYPVTIDSAKMLLLPLQIYHKEIRATGNCERMSLSFKSFGQRNILSSILSKPLNSSFNLALVISI